MASPSWKERTITLKEFGEFAVALGQSAVERIRKFGKTAKLDHDTEKQYPHVNTDHLRDDEVAGDGIILAQRSERILAELKKQAGGLPTDNPVFPRQKIEELYNQDVGAANLDEVKQQALKKLFMSELDSFIDKKQLGKPGKKK
jgi:hypothetical protein